MIWLLILTLLALIALRVPIYLALLAISVGYVAINSASNTVAIQRMFSGLDSFPLLAVPLFVLAGTIMASGGVAARLMGFATTLVGHFRGGLAQVNVLNSLLIGGMSGSANADAAVDAKILVPIMRKQGYSNGFASAISAASGSISPILPPSIGLILYGVLANVSIGDLFVGGIVPGFLIAMALMGTVAFLARRHNYPRVNDRMSRPREILSSFRHSVLALLMPVLLIVGLRMGVFTPTELGAIAVLYSLIVSLFIYKEISWKDLGPILIDSVRTTAMVMVILASAAVFSIVVSYERLPTMFAALLEPLSGSPILTLLVINLLLLTLGLFMESMSLMIILVPILSPIAASLGVDPVHFGLIIVINLTLGSITPPVGSVIYTVMAITKVKMAEFTQAFMPLFAALVLTLLFVTMVPWTVTWLPSILR